MPITTKSAFTYGHKIDDDNQYIDFTEDGMTELSALIDIGSYTLGEFVEKIAQAMNEVGDNEYSASVDRTTGLITISADATFDLLVTTGSHVSISAFSLIGFTTDRSGATSYEADEQSGSYFFPQTTLRNFVDFDDIQESVQAKVNESSSGEIEVVSLGSRNFMECNIKYATDITGQNYIDDNATGVSDLRNFLIYITGKNPIEFIPDKTDLNTFTPCLLESTRRSRDGTGFFLRELYSEGLSNYFESGRLVFRRLS